MEKIEASGRTLEEAISIAEHELNVPADAIEYEIMEEGSKGFLGLGQTPTTINAWVKEGYVPAAKVEVVSRQPVEEGEEISPAEKQEISNTVVSVLQDVLNAMNIDGQVAVKSQNRDEIEIEISGADVAILIGKQGQTLDALQYLISIAANKGRVRSVRVVLDADGYRERHRQALEKTAQDYARFVKEKSQEAVLEPQSARDRRIIHMALAEDPDVYTYSEGAGDDRHVVISPKQS